ncbi:MAG: hypothetical protein M1828_004445 [Chrysothrix sp. TS-e1954]|nr:MAG: hypothetical protein M1828_004445 [Chrysothrix sp. TS-e1954]
MQLRQAAVTAADVHAMTQLNLDAFGYFAARRVMIPNRTPALEQFQEEKALRQLENERNAYFRAMFDDEKGGKLVAFAKWRLEDETEHARPNVPGKWAPDANGEAKEAFFGLLDRTREEIMGDKLYWHLTLLATNPKYERRGCGKQLLEWGLSRADEASLEVYLDATPPGVPLYERNGFRLAGTREFDMRPYGGDFIHTTRSMVRPPPPVHS